MSHTPEIDTHSDMSRPDGGPAFPFIPRASSGNLDVNRQASGMSLQDYFAGMALQGMLAANEQGKNPEDLAARSYRIADAMLTQREQP